MPGRPAGWIAAGDGRDRSAGASATGNGGNDAHLVPGLERRLRALQEPNILLVHVHINEATELALFVAQAVT
jgi:hypothetical protein